MVTIFNKSNKPVGVIGGQYCLPDKSVVIKDKDAFVDVFDEDGNATGEKMLLPGLKALELRGYITIEIKKDAPKAAPKKVEEKAEEAGEEPAAEAEKPVKKTTTRKATKKAE